MYSFLKKYIKSIFNLNFLYRKELLFRFFYGIFFIGNSNNCNICKHNLRTFVSSNNLCPFCGSLPRNRGLYKLLKENNSLKGKILHFSPSRSLFRKLKNYKAIDYYSSDFENEFFADFKFDITNIEQQNETFDTIICFHVLEHVIDDIKAMSELFRVLKTKGKVYIQTPFKDGDIYEDYTIESPEQRKIHFGQEDHVRIYSLSSLQKRLTSVGFKVNVKTFINKEENLTLGINFKESILILTK